MKRHINTMRLSFPKESSSLSNFTYVVRFMLLLIFLWLRFCLLVGYTILVVSLKMKEEKQFSFLKELCVVEAYCFHSGFIWQESSFSLHSATCRVYYRFIFSNRVVGRRNPSAPSSSTWLPGFHSILVTSSISFVLGFIEKVSSNDTNYWALKGISTGFCGCASTFGSVIAITAFSFCDGVLLSPSPHP